MRILSLALGEMEMAGLEVVVTTSAVGIMARALVAVGHPGGMAAADSEVEVTAVIAMKATAAASMLGLLGKGSRWGCSLVR